MRRFIAVYGTMMRLLMDLAVKNLIKVVGMVMVAAILMQILTRLLLRVPFTWTDEVSRGAFVWYCFLGSAMGTRLYAHLGIDYFRSKMSERGQWLCDLGSAIAVAVLGACMTYLGWRLLRIMGIQKTPIMRISMQWFYLSIPLSGALILLQGVEFVLTYLVTGKGQPTLEAAAPPPGSEAFLESAHKQNPSA